MDFRQFSDEEAQRTPRITEEETRAVIRQWQQERMEQGGLTDRPALPDLAEGLGISVEETHRLLDKVRAEREQEERLLAQEKAAAEYDRLRLAEEEQRLAEVYRQRAELERQRANNYTQQRYSRVRPSTAGTFASALGLIFFVLWIAIFIFIGCSFMSMFRPSHFSSQPTCALNNKRVDCSSLPFNMTQGR